MTKAFHIRLYGGFIEIKSNFGRKKVHRTNQDSNFLGYRFSQGYNVRREIYWFLTFCKNSSGAASGSSKDKSYEELDSEFYENEMVKNVSINMKSC